MSINLRSDFKPSFGAPTELVLDARARAGPLGGRLFSPLSLASSCCVWSFLPADHLARSLWSLRCSFDGFLFCRALVSDRGEPRRMALIRVDLIPDRLT